MRGGAPCAHEFCAAHAVPHAKTSEIIVANDTPELASLKGLLAEGRVATASKDSESSMPHSSPCASRRCMRSAALYSPGSGIVDAEALVKALLRTVETAGIIFLPGTKLLDASAETAASNCEPNARRSWPARS